MNAIVPMRRLEGRGAVVTGAGRGGIGRAIARRLAAEGAGVLCADINEEAASETAGIIRAEGGKAIHARCDIADERSAAATVDLAARDLAPLRVLVNNAATWIPSATVVDIALADWNRAMSVNVTGAFLMSKFAIPYMAASGGGSIIHIASQLGQVAKPGRSWYCTAKAALIHLARAMAIDHAPQNIRVNSLSPGPVASDRIVAQAGGRQGVVAVHGPLTLMGRPGEPDEIGAAAAFLASDDASFMTGADMLVDGGYCAR